MKERNSGEKSIPAVKSPRCSARPWPQYRVLETLPIWEPQSLKEQVPDWSQEVSPHRPEHRTLGKGRLWGAGVGSWGAGDNEPRKE